MTAASLHILKKKAYSAYKDKLEETQQNVTFEEWENTMEKKSPHFQFWGLVLHLELTCLRLVRAFREANFALYVDGIRQILPWQFAMDHTNYARWLAVHYRDMQVLSSKHPDVYKHFSDGAFVVHKTNITFSSIALDHAHEQVNALVKGQGGAVGLTESPSALRRWMAASPELSRMVEEFEGNFTVSEERDHHEQKPGVQSTFLEDVVNTVSCFEELSNPFTEESENLMAIHTKDIMDDSVVATVKNAHKIGEEQFCLFVTERFIDRSKPVTDPLKKNILPTFSTLTKKAVSKDQATVKLLKEDCSLFGRLYIACQTRDGNLDESFSYENRPWPPSLSDQGQLRGGQKADLLKCLPQATSPVLTPPVDAVILDGAVIVQILEPKTSRTFDEYFSIVFAPCVLKQLENAKHVDLVWDVYLDDSLKKSLREKRGAGQRRKVMGSTRIPSDWKGFLRVDGNKEKLFKLVADKVCLDLGCLPALSILIIAIDQQGMFTRINEINVWENLFQVVSLALPESKEVYSTHGSSVLTSNDRTEMSNLAPCTHEEADTRLMIHALDASLRGHRRIKIRTNDTDVIVLALSVVSTLPVDEFWITYGSGKNVQHMPEYVVALSLGPSKASALPMFHALTWDVWNVFPELTQFYAL